MEFYKGQQTLNNCNLDYTRSGRGELVILLHGALADQRMWYPHLKLLREKFDVIALTQRHFGEPNSTTGNFGLITHAQDLIAFIKGLTDQKVHLVAWSYGADVALTAAVQRPALFASLFLYEPGFPGYLSETEMAEFGADANQMFGPIFQLAAEGKIEKAVKRLIDGSGNAAGYFDSQSDEAQKQQLQNAHTLPKQLNQTETPPLNKQTLAHLNLPLTIAFGENTRPIFRLVSQATARLIPNSQLICVESTNHMLPLENPQMFVDLVSAQI